MSQRVPITACPPCHPRSHRRTHLPVLLVSEIALVKMADSVFINWDPSSIVLSSYKVYALLNGQSLLLVFMNVKAKISGQFLWSLQE